jgi:hypothetical protein
MLAAASVGAATILAATAALPAVWWEPLHLDEAVTLEFAPRSVPTLLEDVFVDRGGSPVFFLIEHATLRWPGGVEGLRLPPVVFFLLALAAAAPVANELCGRRAAWLLPPLLALAPLAVGLATFARMYTLFLALLLVAIWLLLRAARTGERRRWVLAGACSGVLVYVHPTAPLYIGLALATAFLCGRRPLRQALGEAWPGLAALALVALPYGYALAVLTQRYEVTSSGSSLLEGTGGRPVSVESVLALTPGGWAGAAVFAGVALAGEASILHRDRAKGVAFALWLVVPVAFFSLVPADTRFFARYVLPVAPIFLLLVVAGCLLVGRLVRKPMLAATLLVAALTAWQAAEVADRLRELRELRLASVARAVDRLEGAVVFSSTGGSPGGRPAELVDDYVVLELQGVGRVEELPAVDPRYEPDLVELGTQQVRAFLETDGPPGRGVWIFVDTPRRVLLGERRLREQAGIEVVRLSSRLLLVHSAGPKGRDELVEQAIAVREAWLGPGGRARWARTIVTVDRRATRANR